jgi:hypothetical protein
MVKEQQSAMQQQYEGRIGSLEERIRSLKVRGTLWLYYKDTLAGGAHPVAQGERHSLAIQKIHKSWTSANGSSRCASARSSCVATSF